MKKKMKKIIIFLLIAVFAILFVEIIYNSKVVPTNIIVRDYNTGLPIPNAKVKTTSWEYFGMLGIDGEPYILESETNSKGKTIQKDIAELGNVYVSKDGYHDNGIMNVPHFNDKRLSILPPAKEYTVYLRKEKNVSEYSSLEKKSIDGDKIDLLSLTSDYKKLDNSKLDYNYDFSIKEKDGVVYLEGNYDAGIIAIDIGQTWIRGIPGLKFSKTIDYGNCLSCMNTFSAPSSGYSSKIELKEDSFYIIKLRDGKHFGKLLTKTTFRSNPSLILNFSISTTEGPNIEFRGKNK